MANEPEKATKTGIYVTVEGSPLRIKEGDVVPAGAEFREASDEPLGGESPRAAEKARIAAADAETTPVDARALKAAPENRSK